MKLNEADRKLVSARARAALAQLEMLAENYVHMGKQMKALQRQLESLLDDDTTSEQFDNRKVSV